MSLPRFTPNFKDEAVRQITERGYSVAEISARLGVSAHSLYKGSMLLNQTKQINKPASCWLQKVKFSHSGLNSIVQRRSATF